MLQSALSALMELNRVHMEEHRMKFWLTLLVFVLWPAAVLAQAPVGTATQHIAFDQAAADLPTAAALVYRTYNDGAAVGILVGATCAGTTSPFTCQVLIGAMGLTAGMHTVMLTAAIGAVESVKSAPFTFACSNCAPPPPGNFRIVP